MKLHSRATFVTNDGTERIQRKCHKHLREQERERERERADYAQHETELLRPIVLVLERRLFDLQLGRHHREPMAHLSQVTRRRDRRRRCLAPLAIGCQLLLLLLDLLFLLGELLLLAFELQALAFELQLAILCHVSGIRGARDTRGGCGWRWGLELVGRRGWCGSSRSRRTWCGSSWR